MVRYLTVGKKVIKEFIKFQLISLELTLISGFHQKWSGSIFNLTNMSI